MAKNSYSPHPGPALEQSLPIGGFSQVLRSRPRSPRATTVPTSTTIRPVACAGTWDRGGPAAMLGLASDVARPCRCRGQRVLSLLTRIESQEHATAGWPGPLPGDVRVVSVSGYCKRSSYEHSHTEPLVSVSLFYSFRLSPYPPNPISHGQCVNTDVVSQGKEVRKRCACLSEAGERTSLLLAPGGNGTKSRSEGFCACPPASSLEGLVYWVTARPWVLPPNCSFLQCSRQC